jgi:peptide/nickel transport system permease protein
VTGATLPRLGRLGRSNPLLLAGAVLFALMLAALLLLPLALSVDPMALDYTAILAAPSATHPMGTDELGRDLMARVIRGGQTSLSVGGMVMVLTAVIGTLIGIVAGTVPRLDGVLMRAMDVLMAFPALLLALAVLAAFGNTAINVVLALSLVYIPRTARIVRGEALVQKAQPFVEAAASLGASRLRLLMVHILPGIVPALVVQETFLFAYAILGEAGLSFVGLGLQPPEPSWGHILGGARSVFQTAPWLVIWPGAALALTVLALNLLGDGLGQALDPKRSR